MIAQTARLAGPFKRGGAIVKAQETVSQSISASLYALASALENSGKLHQSLDPYLKLVEKYPESQEAPLAAQRLLTIAENLRRAGHFHLALTVLERLEAAHASSE
jgi:hypothetical protein